MMFVRLRMGFNWQRSDDSPLVSMRIVLILRPGLRCFLVHASFRLLPSKLLQCESTGVMQGLQEQSVNRLTVINRKDDFCLPLLTEC